MTAKLKDWSKRKSGSCSVHHKLNIVLNHLCMTGHFMALWRILCCFFFLSFFCANGKNSGEPMSDALFSSCMTHIVLSIKKPSGRGAVLLQDRADAKPLRGTRGCSGAPVCPCALHLHWRPPHHKHMHDPSLLSLQNLHLK